MNPPRATGGRGLCPVPRRPAAVTRRRRDPKGGVTRMRWPSGGDRPVAGDGGRSTTLPRARPPPTPNRRHLIGVRGRVRGARPRRTGPRARGRGGGPEGPGSHHPRPERRRPPEAERRPSEAEAERRTATRNVPTPLHPAGRGRPVPPECRGNGPAGADGRTPPPGSPKALVALAFDLTGALAATGALRRGISGPPPRVAQGPGPVAGLADGPGPEFAPLVVRAARGNFLCPVAYKWRSRGKDGAAGGIPPGMPPSPGGRCARHPVNRRERSPRPNSRRCQRRCAACPPRPPAPHP